MQVPLPAKELKRKVRKAAERVGLEFFESACAATMRAHRLSCYACGRGPCGDPDRLPSVSETEIEDLAGALGVHCSVLSISERRVVVAAQGRGVEVLKWWVWALTKREFVVTR